jgi:hypothetical protein
MKIINGIKQTLCPTFPRSGHNVIMRVCLGYFEDDLHWNDNHQKGKCGIEKKPNWCNMEKSHDFDLDLKVRDDLMHIVGIRNPIHAIAGWKAMTQREGKTKQDWRPWCKEKMVFYARFVEKWLYTSVPNRLVVSYERLISCPETVCTAIIMHMMENPEKFDFAKLRLVIDDIGIKPQLVKQVPFDAA